MLQICRTCLREITDTNFLALKNDSEEALTIEKELSLCVPEMQHTVSDPVLCSVCVIGVRLMYAFKTTCLTTEEFITHFARNGEVNSKPLSLVDLYKRTFQRSEEPKYAASIEENKSEKNEGRKPTVVKPHYNFKGNKYVNCKEFVKNLNGVAKSKRIYKSRSEKSDIGECSVKLVRLDPDYSGLDNSLKTSKQQMRNENLLLHNIEKSAVHEECKDKTSQKRNFLPPTLSINADAQTSTNGKHSRYFLREYRLTTAKDLPKHPKKGKNEKCSEYRSVTKNTVQQHFATHTYEKLFACDICNFKTMRKWNLKTHKLNQHG